MTQNLKHLLRQRKYRISRLNFQNEFSQISNDDKNGNNRHNFVVCKSVLVHFDPHWYWWEPSPGQKVLDPKKSKITFQFSGTLLGFI